jgi:hypothetical protein
MRRHKATIGMLVIAVPLAPLAGCSDLPGTDEQQGAVGGAVGGAVLGAAVSKNKLLGGLIGGAIGAVGGYLIGANWDKLTGNERDEAIEAARSAESNPATAEQARRATTADINSDGFVTLDEVVAMEKAGFSDDEMVQRLRATDQIFELADEQEDYLTDRGVSRDVIREMEAINQDKREQLLGDRRGSEVIGRDAGDR